ncbi:hypothetical protein Hanom_Chr06g00501621 [Helianthus anomalus]
MKNESAAEKDETVQSEEVNITAEKTEQVGEEEKVTEGENVLEVVKTVEVENIIEVV